MRIRFHYIATTLYTIFMTLYLRNYTYICMFVSALSDPTSNSERSANGGNKQILYCIVLYKVVKSFPSNKAPGRDKVSMAVIKDALPCILPTLTKIVNRSLMSSVFPSRWKESEVI